MTKTTVGTGFFAEWRRDKQSYHFFFLPAVLEPLSGKYTSTRMYTRIVGEDFPSRNWNIREVRQPFGGLPVENNNFKKLLTPSEILDAAVAPLMNYDTILRSIESAEWKPYMSPVAFDISDEDALQLLNFEETTAMNARIYRARSEAGYGASHWEKDAPTAPKYLPFIPTSATQNLLDNINEALSKNSDYEALAKHGVDFPTLPSLLVAVATQRANSSVMGYLDKYRVESSSVGESDMSGETLAPVEDDTASLPESYERPNGEKYFPRMWGKRHDVQVVRTCHEQGLGILLYGPPGTGKTALLDSALPGLYTIMGTGDTTVSEFVGGYNQLADGGYEWYDGPLIKAMESGTGLFVDEIGLIDSKELSILYSVMDGRGELVVPINPARGTVKAAKGFFVVAATNPKAPGVVLSEALVSRFPVQAEMTTNWELVAQQLRIPARIVAACQNMSNDYLAGQIDWAPQYREMMAFQKTMNVFDQSFAIQNLIAGAPEHEREHAAKVLNSAVGGRGGAEPYLGARI